MTMLPGDIEVPGITDEQLAALVEPDGLIRVLCTHCEAPQVVDDEILGSDVACTACKEDFKVSWGSPVIDRQVPEQASPAAERQSIESIPESEG